MTNKNTMDARIKELMAIGATFAEAHKAALDEAIAFGNGKGKKPTGKPAPAKAELVEFVKKDGTVKMVSPKQAAVWEAARSRSNGKTLDEVKAEWNAKHDAYKPSKALIDAIKADRAKVTHKVAKAEYGFVGTKAELKALKDKVLAK